VGDSLRGAKMFERVGVPGDRDRREHELLRVPALAASAPKSSSRTQDSRSSPPSRARPPLRRSTRSRGASWSSSPADQDPNSRFSPAACGSSLRADPPAKRLSPRGVTRLARWGGRVPHPIVRSVESRPAPGKVYHAGGVLDPSRISIHASASSSAAGRRKAPVDPTLIIQGRQARSPSPVALQRRADTCSFVGRANPTTERS
jgi:hypothetical protein